MSLILKIFAISIGCLLFGLHLAYGKDISFSYAFWEFLHFIGGGAIALLFYDNKASLLRILLSVTAVGLLWEIYEYYIRNIEFWLGDTILDFALEFLAAIIVFTLLQKLSVNKTLAVVQPIVNRTLPAQESVSSED